MEKITEESKVLSKKKVFAIYLQLFLTVVTVVLLAFYIFTKNLLVVFQISLGLDLIVMAYNNQSIYQRKYLTIVYALIGIVLILLGVLSIWGVVL